MPFFFFTRLLFYTFATFLFLGVMKKLDEYSIAFKGLKEGEDLFEYDLDDAFFSLFEASQIKTGHLKASVKLNKQEQMLIFEFHIEGQVDSICDRCLDQVELPVQYDGKLFVKFGDTYDEPTEEIIVLPHEEHTINIARYLYEFIIISLPLRHLHPTDAEGHSGCNQEMLNQLDRYLINKPDTDDSEQEEDPIDPRWAALKKLKDKNNQ